MPVHDVVGYVIEGYTAAEALPDPVALNGRTHLLVNSSSATATWSSLGATPFQQGGVNVATVALGRGQALQVQSDGARWVARSSGMRPMYAGTAVSDAAGNAVFTIPTGTFTAAPVVSLAFEGAAGNAPVDYRITARTATSITVNVRQAAAIAVALLGLTILVASAPIAGAVIHAVATPAGTTP